MKPIRVLHIGTRMHNNGGVEKYLMELYRSINKNKVQFDIVSVEDGIKYYYEDEIKKLGANLYKIPDHNTNFIKSMLSKIKIFKKYKHGIIHIHTTSGIRAIDGILARVCGIKNIIFHSHSNMGTPPMKYKITKYLFLLIGSNFFACSKEAGIYFFGKNIIKSKKFLLAKNAVSLEEYYYDKFERKKIRSELDIEGKKVIGYVGRFSEEKNILFIIDVFNELLNQDNEVVLLLVGDGELKEKIEEKVKNKGLEKKVYFTGVRNDIVSIMSALDVLMLPSLHEALGMVLIEAQATGLRCFTSTVVPRETKITENIEYIQLEKSAKQWADIIQRKGFNYERISPHYLLEKKGYDLKKSTSIIENIYLSL